MLKPKYDYTEYECPYAHVNKDCGHELHVADGETRIWCACGFRGPVYYADPEKLGLKRKPEEPPKPEGKGWIRNPGDKDEYPVAPGTKIEVCLRKNTIEKVECPTALYWDYRCCPGDIIWYRVIKKAPKLSPKPKTKSETKDPLTEKYKDSIPKGCVVRSIIDYKSGSLSFQVEHDVYLSASEYHPQKLGFLWIDPEGKGDPIVCDYRPWYDGAFVRDYFIPRYFNHPGELVGVVWKKNINERG